ncbi:hypothetical protein [Micromonospora sp. NBC_01796]|uniref:hypothetical protein n=1 Tax=Micromonospora sp. NBC_01796 TaxID=2975987 RepID=UPI002DDC1ADA|nr:hypothetical protein [Micromonospora sp. NBC_01796]WSA88222.1 hypothetical protein OIE47_11720 [Micromonospora sp. NBC_01796]
MHTDVPNSPEPIAQVTSGMRVIDPGGEEVGTVIAVQLGDPNAVAAQDPPSGDGVLGDGVPHTATGDEPDVPPDLAARLMRTGYLKVDSRGFLAHDLYIEADQIAKVNQDVVELTVDRNRLLPESR